MFGDAGACSESAYQRTVTRLGEALPQSHGAFKESRGCSLYKNIHEVKNRYENPVLIGSGGMKRIYRVLDRMTDREVALAVIHNLGGEQQVEQFILEARVTARLEHPNIMPIYDIGIDEAGEPFFTMKLIRGESLAKIIQRLSSGDKECLARYPLDILLEIFIKVCDAVAYAHNSGLLHLDLKPDNIQVDRFGQVIVCDWGLSRYKKPLAAERKGIEIESGNKKVTLSGEFTGSPGYMSPEQVLKPLSELANSSDIYSLGCILYEILTLKMPIEHGPLKTMLQQTVAGDITPPSLKSPSRIIPASIEAVCLKALAKEPRSRYASSEDLSREIHAFRSGFATEAEKAGFIKNLALLVTRHKMSSTIFATASIVIASIAILSFNTINEKRREAKRQMVIARQEKQRAMEKEKEAKLLVMELVKTRQNDVAPARKSSAVKSYNMFNFKDAYTFLNEALELNPHDSSLYQLLGFMNLGGGKFKEAAEIFKSVDNPLLQKYVQFCESVAPSENEMPKDKFMELVVMLSKDGNETALNQLLITKSERLGVLNERIQFAYDAMGVLNPMAAKIRMDCVILKHGNGLRVSLAGNDNLSNITPLVMLPIKILDLSWTKTHNLNALRRMPLEEVNLCGTLVNSLEPLSGSAVRVIDISDSKIASLNSLEFSNLERLLMKGLELDDFTPLKSYPRLRSITISDSDFNKRSMRLADLPETIAVSKL